MENEKENENEHLENTKEDTEDMFSNINADIEETSKNIEIKGREAGKLATSVWDLKHPRHVTKHTSMYGSTN